MPRRPSVSFAVFIATLVVLCTMPATVFAAEIKAVALERLIKAETPIERLDAWAEVLKANAQPSRAAALREVRFWSDTDETGKVQWVWVWSDSVLDLVDSHGRVLPGVILVGDTPDVLWAGRSPEGVPEILLATIEPFSQDPNLRWLFCIAKSPDNSSFVRLQVRIEERNIKIGRVPGRPAANLQSPTGEMLYEIRVPRGKPTAKPLPVDQLPKGTGWRVERQW